MPHLCVSDFPRRKSQKKISRFKCLYLLLLSPKIIWVWRIMPKEQKRAPGFDPPNGFRFHPLISWDAKHLGVAKTNRYLSLYPMFWVSSFTPFTTGCLPLNHQHVWIVWNLVFSWLGHPSRHRRCSASWRLQCLQLQDVLRWLSTNPSAPEPGNKRTCRAGNPWNPEFARSTILGALRISASIILHLMLLHIMLYHIVLCYILYLF